MAKGSAKSLSSIQKLLAERVQIESWLERLALAGDQTPEDVRNKIRSDYQARLGELLKELATFGTELNDALKRQLLTRQGLAQQEKAAADRLAEAEVRHAVGEYDEAKWRQIHTEYLGSLVRVREELKNADEEIERLEDAVNSLNQKQPGSPVPPSTASVSPPPAAPSSASAAPARKSGPAKQMDALDELAFLKSVTEDEKQGPMAARAAAVPKIPEAIKPPAATPPAPPPPPAPKSTVDVGAGDVAPIDVSGPGKRLTAQLDKSLKCKECGTMNLPTEWYCEKCGAELSESL